MGVEDGEKESSSQYCKGFFDALRVVQSTNKFEFNGVTSPVLPNNLSTAAFSPITPATASDMHTIVMSILGTPITSASSTIPPLSSPTSLLPLVTSGDLQMDDLSMKLLASSAIPGPPIVSSSNSPDSSSAVNTTTTQITALPPLLNNFVSSTTASTSRPDKLNLTPPQSEISMSMANYSDDSDGGFDSRSASRAGGSGGMSMDDQEKKKLERKRARNRQAASKCRQKKMDRIKELEDQVLHEKHRGQRLDAELVELNRALANFRQMVERHSNTGCPNNSIRA
ncbi:hypothetical protein L3Y34_017881 [Caenorhabditis briggsae]|nr:hypothetical protein L3Y34_017881 [Caenorhabditis briggsae]